MKAFVDYHPMTSLIYFVGAITITMLFPSPIITTVSFLGAILYLAEILDAKSFNRNMSFNALIIALITISNPVFSHRGATVLFTVLGKSVTFESLAYGFCSGLMIVSVLNWFQCFCTVFTSDKIMFVLGKKASKTALMISMIIRYMPMLKNKYLEFSRYHQDRKTLKERLNLFSVLVGWSLEKAIETADSMQARGYGICSRRGFSLYKLCFYDFAVIFASLSMLGLIITGAFLGKLAYSFYPNMKFTLSYFHIFAALLFTLPITNDVLEKIKWNLLKRKI